MRAESSSSARSSSPSSCVSSTEATIAPSMSATVCGGRGLELEAGHRRERVDVGGAEDVADLAEGGVGRPRCRARRRAASTASPASSAANSSSTIAVEVAEDRQRRRRSTSDSGSPAASTASASGSASAAGTEMSTGRPSMLDSAVPAVPEPMLASSRSASSCMSVYWTVRSWRQGSLATGRRRRDRRRQRVAVDDQRDVAVGQHGAAGQRPRCRRRRRAAGG